MGYMAFILFTMLGLLNVVVGVFVNETGGIEHWDRELVLQNTMARQEAKQASIKDLFREIDHDRKGKISLQEIESALADERIRAHFDNYQIDVLQADKFFALLDSDKSGFVDETEFIKGCMRLQGHAKPMDVANLILESQALVQKVDNLTKSLHQSEQ